MKTIPILCLLALTCRAEPLLEATNGTASNFMLLSAVDTNKLHLEATVSFETVTNVTAFVVTNQSLKIVPALRTTVKRQTWIQFVAGQTPFKALLKEETVSDWIEQWEEKKNP